MGTLVSSAETKKRYWERKLYNQRTKKFQKIRDRQKSELKRGLRRWVGGGTAVSDGKGWYVNG